MPFCPECKSMVYPDPKTKQQQCRKCGWSGEAKGGTRVVSQKATEKEVLVFDENTRTIETRGTTDTECPKCGHGKAYAEFKQTRSSDEPQTMFLECHKCAHRWRQY